MYKTILVAVDESDVSKSALEEAVNLAHHLKSRLTIIHVVDVALAHTSDTGLVHFDIVSFKETMLKNGQKLLNQLASIANFAGVTVETKLIENTDFSRVADKILEASYALKVELLVLGTHGRGGFRKLMLGSVAEDIIRAATVPVLLTRGQKV